MMMMIIAKKTMTMPMSLTMNTNTNTNKQSKISSMRRRRLRPAKKSSLRRRSTRRDDDGGDEDTTTTDFVIVAKEGGEIIEDVNHKEEHERNSNLHSKKIIINKVEEYLKLQDELELNLQIALGREDYKRATEIKNLLQQPKTKKEEGEDINFSILCELCRCVCSSKNAFEIEHAAKKLQLVGDTRALPALARALLLKSTAHSNTSGAIEAAMWSLFMKSGDLSIDLKLKKGTDYMHGRYMVLDKSSSTTTNKDGDVVVKAESVAQTLELQAAERLRNLQEATRIFTEIIQEKPLFAEAWNKRATCNYLQGEFDNACADAEEAFRLNPNHFGALSGIGLCKFATKKYDDALHFFELTLKVNPHIESIQRYARELRKTQAKPRIEMSKFNDAMNEYKKSIEIEKDEEQAPKKDEESPTSKEDEESSS